MKSKRCGSKVGSNIFRFHVFRPLRVCTPDFLLRKRFFFSFFKEIIYSSFMHIFLSKIRYEIVIFYAAIISTQRKKMERNTNNSIGYISETLATPIISTLQDSCSPFPVVNRAATHFSWPC